MANLASLDGPFPAVNLRFTLGYLLEGIRLSYARALMETGLFVLTRVFPPVEARVARKYWWIECTPMR